MQADTIVRRHTTMRIASLRLHWSVCDRFQAQRDDAARRRKNLWGYVQEDSAAEAFLLAITGENRWSGHEAFFIVAPRIASDQDTKTLREEHWPGVSLKEGKDVSGSTGFFDCSKAERLLGWVHRDTV